MRKSLLLMVMLTIAGCSSTSNMPSSPNAAGAERALADEEFLIISGNYPRLIAIYKEKLKQEDSAEIRLKLAKVYLDTNDNESALFTIVPVITGPNASAEAFYVQGLAEYNLGEVARAERSLSVAVNKEPNNAKLINLLGAAQAELGQLDKARKSFNRARSLLYDDVAINNNLALVDLIEGNYQQAASRLRTIYQADPSGADKQLKANLAIAAAKLGSFEMLRTLYGNQYSESELFGIFHGLRASTFTPSLSFKNGVKSDLFGEIGGEEAEVDRNKPKATKSNTAETALTPVDLYPGQGLSEIPKKQGEEAFELSSISVQSTTKVEAANAEDTSLQNRVDDVVDVDEANKVSLDLHSRQSFTDLVGLERNYGESSSSSVVNVSKFSTILKAETAPQVESPKASVTPAVEINTAIEPVVLKSSEPTSDLDMKKSRGALVNEPKKKWEFVVLEAYPLISTDGVEIPMAQFKRHQEQLTEIQQGE